MSNFKYASLAFAMLVSSAMSAQNKPKKSCCAGKSKTEAISCTSKSKKGLKTDSNGKIVMTKAELKSFLETVANAKREKLAREQREQDELALLKAKVKYYEAKENQNNNSAHCMPHYYQRENYYQPQQGNSNNNTSADIERLNNKLDYVLSILADESKAVPTEQVVAMPNTDNADLRSQISRLESRLQNANAQERRSILEDLLKKYGNFRKQVFFANDSKALNSSDLRYIREVADVLTKHKELSIVLEGYASPVGNENYNKALSMQRAEAVKEAIERYGISSERVLPAFKGEDHSGSEEYARRVDMTIVLK